jgi:thioredoxin-like negative regulator of GroEL
MGNFMQASVPALADTGSVASTPAATVAAAEDAGAPQLKPTQPLVGKITMPGISNETTSVEVLKARVAAAPQDAKARFNLAHALRLQGNNAQACSQLLEATSTDPSYFLAYHELTLSKPSAEQVDEAIERLNRLRDLCPRELMLRVALSELLELKGDNYSAARALVDLVYEQGVPPQHMAKVQARIHFLLSRTKDAQTTHTATEEDGGLDSLAPSMPETGYKRNIATTKVQGKDTQSFGNSTLLP